jgi:hypothetical protein
VVENTGLLVDWSKSLATLSLPRPPEWVQTVPLVGANLASRWEQLANAGSDEIAARLGRSLSNWRSGSRRRSAISDCGEAWPLS